MDKSKIRKDSPSKSASVKSEKSSTTKKNLERKNSEQSIRKFAIISTDSVASVAESIGIADLSDEVCLGLAEDVSYKLREMAHVS